MNAEFSCWKDDEKFDVRVFDELLLSESFNNWERVCDGLSTSCSITANEVLSTVNDFKGGVLDWEEEFDSFFLEHLNHSRVLDEVGNVLVFLSFWLRFFWIHERSR